MSNPDVTASYIGAQIDRLADQRNLFRQLTSEALALLDEHDPDHDHINLRDWLRNARQALERA